MSATHRLVAAEAELILWQEQERFVVTRWRDHPYWFCVTNQVQVKGALMVGDEKVPVTVSVIVGPTAPQGHAVWASGPGWRHRVPKVLVPGWVISAAEELGWATVSE